jgi:predicted O-linked N-acetylglucosamine transferase (SPINDLY family)
MSVTFQKVTDAAEQENASFQALLQADPDSLFALFGLGKLCLKQQSLEEAHTYLTRVLEIQPDHADAWFQLGTICRLRGRTSEAIALSYRAYELNPNHAAAHAQALLCMHALPDFTAVQIFAEHLRWANIHALFDNIPIQYQNSLEPERKLKIGYLFDNGHTCSMAEYFESLLAHHNPEHFEIYCYALSAKQNETTFRLAKYVANWRDASDLSLAERVDVIHEDAIDILVDLAGHTNHNSLLILASKPAPIQVTYLGYPGTTGMAQVDYCFTDTWLDPPNQPLLASEELLHLSEGFLRYHPAPNTPDLESPPSARKGYVTFGCIHSLEKISEVAIALWSQILLSVPNSKLLLLNPALQEAGTCEQYYARFGQHGVGRERLVFLNHKTARFSIYTEIDIALDTFPSSSMASSCDALWMGVPVITLAGNQQRSRVGASILSTADLSDLIAFTPELYVQKAVELAGNAELLLALRMHLRAQLLQSSLCNGQGLAEEIENLYHKIWQRWCTHDEMHQTFKPTNRRRVKIERQLISPNRAAQWQTLSKHCTADYADLHDSLGLMWCYLGKPAQAENCFRCAVKSKPNFPEAWSNLGMVLFAEGKVQEAIECSQEALRLKPDFEVVYQNLGEELTAIDRFTEALEHLKKSVTLNPNLSKSYRSIGEIYQFQGRVAEALPCYRQSVALEPNAFDAQAGLSWIMHYVPECSPQECFAQLKCCGQVYSQNVRSPAPHLNNRNPSRKLRIGYLSPDLHEHSVANFFEPLLSAHHQEMVETFCYAEEFKLDHVTARLQKLANHWRSTCGLSDEAVSCMIRADQIDILVDLAGYTQNSRIRVMAYKPAPVTFTYLGYPNTTGIPQIDYRIVDAWTDPPDQPALCTETLVRLEDGFLCYQPPLGAPENGSPPILNCGHITFGSFNVLAKMNAEVARLWAKILCSVPYSRLFLKSQAFTQSSTQEYWKTFFEREGVHPDRLELLGWCKEKSAHLSLYGRVDIALDPFPYNGTTTTCEALWMGVPVISLAGNSHVSRVGVSLLSNLQLEELIAYSEQEYLEIAVQLAQDSERLTLFRESIRPWMSASPLCDSEAFAFKLEAAYRQMWRKWCENG